jgi:hypothetical protein
MIRIFALCTGYIEAGATMFYGHDPEQWAETRAHRRRWCEGRRR